MLRPTGHTSPKSVIYWEIHLRQFDETYVCTIALQAHFFYLSLEAPSFDCTYEHKFMNKCVLFPTKSFWNV